MKNFTLLLSILFSIQLIAQETVWSDDFDDADISDWTLVDSDGDGANWIAVQIVDDDDVPVGTPVLRSASWSGSALTPDNWAISPMMNLSGASGAISLNYEVMAIDASWDIENYTVYAATGNTIDDFLASDIYFNESTLDGVNTLTPRTLDLSDLAGEPMVYIAFRHHDVTDQFTIEIDNVVVEAETLSIDEFDVNNVQISVSNNLIKVTNLNNSAQYQLFSITGQKMLTGNLDGSSQSTISTSNLTRGIYVIQLSSSESGSTLTKKIVI
ncbi:choice-of-anchor J domain-containing protein [Mangrovimonas sp. ST2L15]|uniref:T9SS-dependent choice-of-anchor J family protein n=1 Tax=Mangrovimonas sp. ST2L15 TaxID=1645916 RepID=UPI0006B422AF|nr:choice-of-anchor J domain-containing protein [Mangrovimonas sp. ST2L15]